MLRYNLLIIDDEERYANMLAKRLVLRGCDCEVCHNGLDAIRVVMQKRFCLIVLDLRLPDVYGTNVLRKIKEINAEQPVAILTGHGTEKDRKECMALGADAFMHKPLDVEELLALLGRIGKCQHEE